MNGGHQGSRNYLMFYHKDRQYGPVSHVAQYELKKGEVVRLHSGTGGGYGNPLERPVEMIQDDVRNGYVTLDQAKKDYGVVLDPNTLEVVKLSRGREEILQ
jgi:N-methylhydantoinase B